MRDENGNEKEKLVLLSKNESSTDTEGGGRGKHDSASDGVKKKENKGEKTHM